jgi:hypothetical protein
LEIATTDWLLVFNLQVKPWQVAYNGSFRGNVQHRVHVLRVNAVVEVAERNKVCDPIHSRPVIPALSLPTRLHLASKHPARAQATPLAPLPLVAPKPWDPQLNRNFRRIVRYFILHSSSTASSLVQKAF